MPSNKTPKPPSKRGPGRPKGSRTIYDEAKHCGARVRSKGGDPCTHVKGYGTPHPGVGRCKFHGGLTPIKHGRYSRIKRSEATARYHELLEQFESEANPLDLVPDLIHLRAKAALLHEQEEELRQQLSDWHESYTGAFRAEMRTLRQALRSNNAEELGKALRRLGEILNEMPPKPAKLWDPYAYTKAMTAAAQLVGRITEQRERQQVPLKAVIDLQDKMSMVMMSEIRKVFAATPEVGNALAQSIADAWLKINIEL